MAGIWGGFPSPSLAAEHPLEKRFLSVHPIAGLLEDDALRAFHDAIGDLFAAMGGKAVHHFCVFGGRRQKLFVDLERLKLLRTASRFVFLAHTGPDVGVNHIGLGHSSLRVGHLHEAIASGQMSMHFNEGLVERVAARSAKDELNAEFPAGECERPGDVVAVADERYSEAFQRAEHLAHRQQIAERLARMAIIGQAIDDGDRRPVRHFGDGGVLERSQHEDVAKLTEIARDIGEAFAGAQADVVLREEDAAAAEMCHGGLEADARSQGRLFEEQAKDFARENRLGLAASVGRLHFGRVFEKGEDLLGIPVDEVEKMSRQPGDFGGRSAVLA